MNFVRNTYAWFRRPNKSTAEQYLETFLIVVPLAFIIRTYFYGLYQVPTGSMETTMLVGERFFADKLSVNFYPPERGDIISFNDPKYDYSDNWLKNKFQHYVWGPSNWTKRVIGKPGDHVQGVMEDGKPVVYLNGQKLDEPYLNKYPIIAVYHDGCILHKSYDEQYSYQDQPFYRINKADVDYLRRRIPQNAWARYPQTPTFEGSRNVDEYDIHLGPKEYWVMGDNRLGSADSRFWGPLNQDFIHGKIIFCIFSIDQQESWLFMDILLHPIDFWSRVRWSRCFHWLN